MRQIALVFFPGCRRRCGCFLFRRPLRRLPTFPLGLRLQRYGEQREIGKFRERWRFKHCDHTLPSMLGPLSLHGGLTCGARVPCVVVCFVQKESVKCHLLLWTVPMGCGRPSAVGIFRTYERAQASRYDVRNQAGDSWSSLPGAKMLLSATTGLVFVPSTVSVRGQPGACSLPLSTCRILRTPRFTCIPKAGTPLRRASPSPSVVAWRGLGRAFATGSLFLIIFCASGASGLPSARYSKPSDRLLDFLHRRASLAGTPRLRSKLIRIPVCLAEVKSSAKANLFVCSRTFPAIQRSQQAQISLAPAPTTTLLPPRIQAALVALLNQESRGLKLFVMSWRRHSDSCASTCAARPSGF